jgi:hypothetical protein
MREIKQTVYEAFDGTVYKSAKECSDYEKATSYKRLIGLTEKQIADAFHGKDPDLAEAIKTVGYQIARAFPTGERAAKRHAAKADGEPELPEPVGRGDSSEGAGRMDFEQAEAERGNI